MTIDNKIPPIDAYNMCIPGLHTGFFLEGGGGDLTDDLHVCMYMRRCHAYILVHKSHNNAVITNFFFLLVCVVIGLAERTRAGAGGTVVVDSNPA